MSELEDKLKKITDLEKQAMQKAQAHWDNLAKPLRSLGRLEDMIIQLAGITGSRECSIAAPINPLKSGCG